jgi:hypothetical protein
MLSISTINKYNDPQFIEDINGTYQYPTNVNTVWTIKNPSKECQTWYKKNCSDIELRKYADDLYLMSKAASEKIKPEGNNDGEVCVIEFTYDNDNYYLFTIDNKPYIQNVQGCKEPFDIALGDCIIRELQEEIGLYTTKDKLRQIGYWSFMEINTIVNKNALSESKVFYLYTHFENVKQLFPKNLENDKVNIVDVKDIGLKLNETIYILAIPKSIINVVPSIIGKNTFCNHHRECIHRLNGTKKFNVDYLCSFFIKP